MYLLSVKQRLFLLLHQSVSICNLLWVEKFEIEQNSENVENTFKEIKQCKIHLISMPGKSV